MVKRPESEPIYNSYEAAIYHIARDRMITDPNDFKYHTEVPWKSGTVTVHHDELCPSNHEGLEVIHHCPEGVHYCPTGIMWCFDCDGWADEPEPYECTLWNEWPTAVPATQ